MILAARCRPAPRGSDRLCAVRNAAVALIVVAIAAGCATQGPRPSEIALAAPANLPLQYYRDAVAKGETVYSIDPAQSVLVIEVHRAGSLARLGHDHVVASHDVRGFVAPRANRADLYVRLDQLVIDEPELRKQAGFDTRPTDDDIAGTRRNMLTSLDAESFPYALIHLTGGAEPVTQGGGFANKVDKILDVTIGVRGRVEFFAADARQPIEPTR